MRLIDADGLIKHIQTTYCKDCKDCNKDKDLFHCRTEQIIGDIHYAPTVDQWHYPSKGELPPMDTRVYLWTKGDVFPVVARRHDFHRSNEEWSWDCYWGSGFEIKANADCIIAWQYIIPPQEEV